METWRLDQSVELEYTAAGSIDGSKVQDKILANTNFTAEWTNIVTEAVNNCTTGANGFDFDTSKLPTPPPRSKNTNSKPKCNFKAMAFVGCVKRYLTINCAASATTTSAPCTEIINKLKECDPFYVPPPPTPRPSKPPTNAGGANPEKVKVAQSKSVGRK
ncbi:hypothetical protein B566_EDAN018239 [Ephemera danica]|nr:hypothetical protein B566_EDAN018239 [Ephemera danica]